jgi:hypothetical protein
MGVADYGSGSTGLYNYSTSQFLGEAVLGSTLAKSSVSSQGDDVSYQLNVVLVLSDGSTSMDYWVQNMVDLDTSSQLFGVENNIWNLSAPSSTMRSSTLHGNGSISNYQQTTYYGDAPGSSYPGNLLTLSYPANFSVKVVTSDIDGLAQVGFSYEDGSGWVTYDNVTFPWSRDWTDDGFAVAGGSSAPSGLDLDAEWVVAGEFSGADAAWSSSDQTLELEYFNGNNFEAVPNAYDYGSDTAETSTHLQVSPRLGLAPGAHVTTGAGSLGMLYTQSQLAYLQVATSVPSGTVVVNGSATGFVGHGALLALGPGLYQVGLENGSRIVRSRDVALAAGQALTVAMLPGLSFSPPSGLGNATVTAKGAYFVPGSQATVRWVRNGSLACQSAVSAYGTFSCPFFVPVMAAGSYQMNASDSASPADYVTSPFRVTTTLAVTIRCDRNSVDLGQNVSCSFSSTGGYPPYSPYAWSLGDGTAGNGGSVTHGYAATGTFDLRVSVTDAIGSTVNASEPFTVYPDPTVGRPVADRPSADVGQNATITVPFVAEAGGANLSWTGLPEGCRAAGAAAACAPLTEAGNWTVEARLTDANGLYAQSAPLSFTVYPWPEVSIEGRGNAFDEGQSARWTAVAVGGSGDDTFAWSGLPYSCEGPMGTADCYLAYLGKLTITVRATDSDQATAVSPPLQVAVAPALRAAIATAPASAVTGALVTFNGTSTGGTGDRTYAWQFGDGGQAAGPVVDHAFARPGSFVARLWVNDSVGGSGNTSFVVNVTGAATGVLLGWSAGTVAVLSTSLGLVVAAAIVLALRRRSRSPRTGPGAEEPGAAAALDATADLTRFGGGPSVGDRTDDPPEGPSLPSSTGR